METLSTHSPGPAGLPLPEMVAELAAQSARVNAARARQVELVAAIARTQTVEAE